MSKNTLKSIGAVVLGALVGILLSTGSDAMMRLMGFFTGGGPPTGDGPFAVATIYRTVYGVVGAYIAARLAPDRPLMHALILGFLGFIASTAGAVVMWNKLPVNRAQMVRHRAHRSCNSDRLGGRCTPPGAVAPPDLALACSGPSLVLAVLVFVAFALQSHRTLKRAASSHSDLHHLIDAIGIKNH